MNWLDYLMSGRRAFLGPTTLGLFYDPVQPVDLGLLVPARNTMSVRRAVLQFWSSGTFPPPKASGPERRSATSEMHRRENFASSLLSVDVGDRSNHKNIPCSYYRWLGQPCAGT